MTNIYCYGILKTDDIITPMPEIAGIEDHYKLYSIPYEDLNMVVSKVSEDEFSEDKLNYSIEDIKWLSHYAVCHEKVVETVMKYYSPLLPMKFCTIYKCETNIEMLLKKHYARFKDTLSFFRGKEEHGVKIYVDRSIFRKKMRSEETLPEDEDANSSISGRNYLLKRKIEKECREALIAELSTRVATIHSFISEWAAATVSNKIINHGSKTKGEMLVHNASYFVEDRYLDKFCHIIEQLKDKYTHEGFRLITSGPWPPYNFVNSALSPFDA